MTAYLPILVFVLGAAIGVALGWVLGRRPATGVDAALHETIALRARLEHTTTDLTQQRALADDLRAELTTAREQITALSTERKALDAASQQLHEQFENLANRIFEDKQKAFAEQSQKGLAEVLNPMRERLSEFQKKVDDSFGQQAKEQFSLKEQIERVVTANQNIGTQAENLARALKGDQRIQGNWGEIILERILEQCGMREGEEFTLQGAALGLKHAETGQHLKPDVIVNLPHGKHIIIDSKVSLVHYERAFNAADDLERAQHHGEFLRSLRKHVQDLEQRRYQDSEGLGTPDIVLMFVPVEGAYHLALQLDAELHGYAWGKRVAIVGPSTLYAALKTITAFWQVDLNNKNALEIARQAGALYDKFAGFVEDMDRIGTQLERTQVIYGAAMGKLKSGRGNLVGSTERLRRLGVQTSKQLHVFDTDDDPNPAAQDDMDDDTLVADHTTVTPC